MESARVGLLAARIALQTMISANPGSTLLEVSLGSSTHSSPAPGAAQPPTSSDVECIVETGGAAADEFSHSETDLS